MATSIYHNLLDNLCDNYRNFKNVVTSENIRIVRGLIEQSEKGNFDINYMDYTGFTLLHYAVSLNN